MAIYYLRGDILDSGAQVLVNPVNCVGVMGAGLAAKFKKRFPGNYEYYRGHCDNGTLAIGGLVCWDGLAVTESGPWIVNFPTKDDWKDPSKIEYIELGLDALVEWAKKRKIHSIAIPALGCGLGGLPWDKVQKLIDEAFRIDEFNDVLITVYLPEVVKVAK